jgi:hypothetical protein
VTSDARRIAARSRQLHHEARAAALAVLHPRAAAHARGEAAHHREPDPAAGARLAAGGVRVAVAREAHERLPHPVALGRGHARAAVLDPHARPRPAGVGAEPHGLARGAVLGGVVEEVEHDLPQRGRVHHGRGAVVHRGDEPRVRRGGERRERRGHRPEQRRERGGPRVELHRAALGLREVQHVLHELQEAAGLLHHRLGRRAALLGRAHAVERERLAEEEDLGERGAQLVRHARREVGAQAGQLLPRRSCAIATAARAALIVRQPSVSRSPGPPRGRTTIRCAPALVSAARSATPPTSSAATCAPPPSHAAERARSPPASAAARASSESPPARRQAASSASRSAGAQVVKP